ncbi:hypothetical protein M2145_000167 [Lachnospiraceae bacterium PF1-21]|uniref:IS66 family insertion sequence element accessory protein TnpB n=1 Tax=Ohessyouella blattaphilus TaxID=2949333 RepID=A0ABT1EHH8_9FIRM|nr:IS66 family insertion sequence element accessory protein TnpB [Ohessyouella blattaphilus]MCP1110153.1 IS66 family insertion sequence element accessory protein TnpB [Ohessyouella blattaphilus]MCR8563547.1 IS66 family insertion sequence element accessory protein TnpB [Ohessyouella blattaphilus]
MLKSEAMIARQYRLQEWAEQIKDCNNRPYKVTVEDWCDANGITKANYYYRLKKVRQAYLANGIDAEEQTSIVQVPIAKTAITTVHDNSEPVESQNLELSVGAFSLKVNGSTSMELLDRVLRVIANA